MEVPCSMLLRNETRSKVIIIKWGKIVCKQDPAAWTYVVGVHVSSCGKINNSEAMPYHKLGWDCGYQGGRQPEDAAWLLTNIAVPPRHSTGQCEAVHDYKYSACIGTRDIRSSVQTTDYSPFSKHQIVLCVYQRRMDKLNEILGAYVAKGSDTKDKLLGAAFTVVNKDGESF